MLTVQVAVPKYPWTDLAYSLAPSGRGPNVYSTSTGPQSSRNGVGNPFGVGKTSYIAGLYSLGNQDRDLRAGHEHDPAEPRPRPGDESADRAVLRLARAASPLGEPYSTGPATDDPVVGQLRRAFAHWHSAYYQPGWRTQKAAGRTTAVFSISGWTDDLFPAVESFRMYNFLKSLDPQWPVAVRVADIGHARAQNKPGTWHRLNDAGLGLPLAPDGARPPRDDHGGEPGHRLHRQRVPGAGRGQRRHPGRARTRHADHRGDPAGGSHAHQRDRRPGQRPHRRDRGGSVPFAPTGHGGCTVGNPQARPGRAVRLPRHLGAAAGNPGDRRHRLRRPRPTPPLPA